MIFFIIALILIVILVFWIILTYNNFIKLQENVSNAKAQIAAQIESRWEVVNNLIEATKQYTEYEANTLLESIRQRTNVGRSSSIKDIQKSENQFNQLFGQLIALSENYPDLKANTIYQTTMEKIDKHENNV